MLKALGRIKYAHAYIQEEASLPKGFEILSPYLRKLHELWIRRLDELEELIEGPWREAADLPFPAPASDQQELTK